MLRTDTPHPDYRPCVGIMLFNGEGKIWLGQRSDIKENSWQMPQGGIDPGETPFEAAARELWEEVGTRASEVIGESSMWLAYDFPAEILKKSWKGKYRGQTQKWFLMRFVGTDDDIDLTVHHQEFDLWEWVAPDEAARRVVDFKREVYEAVVAEFEPHIQATIARSLSN